MFSQESTDHHMISIYKHLSLLVQFLPLRENEDNQYLSGEAQEGRKRSIDVLCTRILHLQK